LLSRAAADGRFAGLKGTQLAFLSSSKVATLLTLMALGEALADKLLPLPGRNTPLVLTNRAASGALVGSALFTAARRDATPGAALAALAATATGAGASYLRQVATQRWGLPDPVVAILEDVVVVAGGSSALRT
jgi:uncharacterized membrane protein